MASRRFNGWKPENKEKKIEKMDDLFAKRKQHIQHYLYDAPCTYSLSVELDITHLLSELKSRGLKLYPALI